jgi:hypothetical protein
VLQDSDDQAAAGTEAIRAGGKSATSSVTPLLLLSSH